MLIELITPLVLATAPTAVIVPETAAYNHQTQMVAMNSAKDSTAAGITFNGTQTFGSDGRPRDSDTD
jgi:hypothetical protein